MVELKFCHLNIDCFHGYSIRPLPTSSVVLFTAASDVAFGEFSCNLNVLSFSCMWLRAEKGHSSAYGELIAIYYVNYSNVKKLENKKVKVLMNNDNATAIVLLAVPNHIFKH